MSAVLHASRSWLPPPAWRTPLLALAALLTVLLLAYRGTLTSMVGIWARSDTFAHAYLVLPISLWLVWRMRERLAPLSPKPAPWLLLPFAALALAWLLGDLAGVNALTQFALVGLVVTGVALLLGLEIAKAMAFPLGFMFFMVPFGEFLLPLMMEATADFTVAAVAMSGVPVYREGLQFVIPSGAWSVVEACSGVRYLIASFMVGTLFAYLNYNALWRRLVFCAVAIAVPVLANWLRAYMIVMLGHLSGNKIAVGVDHLIYGWVFFGVVILLMFLIGARWSEPEAVFEATELKPSGATGRSSVLSWSVALLAVVVLAAPQAVAWQFAHANNPKALDLTLPQLADAPAAATQATLPSPTFPGAAAQATRTYDQGDGSVTVHVAYFRQQGYGAKLASSENVLVRSDDKAWIQLATNRTPVTVADRTVVMRTTEIIAAGALSSTGRPRIEARQLYWVGGRLTTNDHLATLLGVYGRLTGAGDDGAVITFYAQGESRDITTPRLDLFIASHLAAIENQLSLLQRAR